MEKCWVNRWAQKKKKKMTVKESQEILINDESDKLIEQDKIIKAAKIFNGKQWNSILDEIDKYLEEPIELVEMFGEKVYKETYCH